jgi:hypothetical protein
MSDQFEIDAASNIEHVFEFVTTDHISVWQDWIELIFCYRLNLAHGRFRLEQDIFPLLPDIKVGDVIAKCFFSGTTSLYFHSLLAVRALELKVNGRLEYLIDEQYVSPFERYRNRLAHIEFNVDCAKYPYVYYIPLKWLELPPEDLLIVFEHIQSVLCDLSFMANSFNWNDFRKRHKTKITRKKLQEILTNRYHIENITSDFAQICVYIVLRYLETSGKAISIDELEKQFLSFTEQDILLFIGYE